MKQIELGELDDVLQSFVGLFRYIDNNMSYEYTGNQKYYNALMVISDIVDKFYGDYVQSVKEVLLKL